MSNVWDASALADLKAVPDRQPRRLRQSAAFDAGKTRQDEPAKLGRSVREAATGRARLAYVPLDSLRLGDAVSNLLHVGLVDVG